MPYLKPDPIPFISMRRLLLGYEINGSTLATILDVEVSTARRRLRNPETLTLRELALINKYGRVPAEEIREAIKF